MGDCRNCFLRYLKKIKKYFCDSNLDAYCEKPIKRLFIQYEDSIHTDNPILEIDSDAFNRSPFAKRISEIISNRKDPSCIVIGIYGKWGEGKTTLINFIANELENNPKLVTLKYNPWRFDDDKYLYKYFFSTLADKLKESLLTDREMIGTLLERYGNILVPVSVGIGGFLNFSPGEKLKELGGHLSSVELDELKNRIEKILKDQDARIVIFMDDIDRLDKTEIQAIFKLVKLSANFDNIAYVLALDESVVAKALGELYGNGGEKEGKYFLEKIIQFPIHLPVINKVDLRSYCLKFVEKSIDESGIILSKNEIDTFLLYFVKGLESRVSTPRIAKRYANALVFSLPLLKGEVNTVDLLLVEGIRIFYPDLYQEIRLNSNYFLGLDLIKSTHPDHIGFKKSIDEIIERTLVNFGMKDKKAINGLCRKPSFCR